jgi:C4-dicarboxylate-specific signal transduction histidine kinase
LQDVTASKLAEEALNKARSELAHVARITTLNALTASIAHEINQPLASLVTNASICLRRLNADPPNVNGARETVLRTIRDANRASDVITRLRALFSKKEFTLETLDLNEVTREIIALFSDDLERKRVLLLTDFEAGLPAVKGDRVQLQQVILNLLRNASEAMSTVEDRSKELVVNTAREHGDLVRLSVKDSGVGLELLALDRLFQPFYTTKQRGWVWDYPSAALLSRLIMGVYGQNQMLVRGRHFRSPFQMQKLSLPSLHFASAFSATETNCAGCLKYSRFCRASFQT